MKIKKGDVKVVQHSKIILFLVVTFLSMCWQSMDLIKTFTVLSEKD